MREIAAKDLAVVVGQHEEKIKALKETFEDHEERQTTSLDKIWKRLDQFAGRPTWSILTVITLLSTICAGLAVWALTR
ncbi:MAG TPA: hypothetical protein VGL40_09485 [Bacillota bacterium]